MEKTANSAEFQSGQSSNQPSQAGDQTDEQDLSVTFSSTDLLTNRPETENGVFSVTAVSVDPEFGSITDNADGSWTFTPAEDFTGKDVQVKFSISDDLSGNENIVTAIDITPDSNNGPQNPVAKNTDSTAVPIYPNAVNEAPIVGQVDLGAIKEDSAIKFSAKELLAHSSDADGDSLSVVNVSVDEQYGKIEFNTDNAGHIETIKFTPAENFTGEDIPLKFTVTDGQEKVDGIATIDVSPVNDGPVVGKVDLGGHQRRQRHQILCQGTAGTQLGRRW